MKKKALVEPEMILMEWRVNTCGLLTEIATKMNPKGAGVLSKPIQIFANLLYEVGERASQLNDPIMNGLMARLAIYEVCDPYSKEYDQKVLDKVMEEYKQAKEKLKEI